MACGDGLNDFNLGDNSVGCGGKALERDTDDTGLDDIKVGDRDIDVGSTCIAAGVDLVPGLRVGGDVLIARRVVLLEGN